MAAPPPHGGVRVLRTEHVTPPASALSEDRAVPLTFLDATWLHAKPVERVFFYRLVSVSGADGVDGMLSKLADSLSQALGTFYPLAGRIRLKPGETNRYELFSQPGDGVAFTVAEQDGVSIEELATDVEREVAKIVPLVPALPEGGAVLAVQATILLPAPAGLALGITMHHAACDGTSSTHFLHTWAAACAAAEVSPEPPVIDRSFIIDRKDLHDVFARPSGPSPWTRRCAASPGTGRGGRSASSRRAGTVRPSRWPDHRGSACTAWTLGSGSRRRWRSYPWRGPARCRWRRAVAAPTASRWASPCRQMAWTASGGASTTSSRASRPRDKMTSSSITIPVFNNLNSGGCRTQGWGLSHPRFVSQAKINKKIIK
uniref:Uncharacterized protein n=1 Tax=Oryza brachyantha TaxID=4533 RepID=J3LCX2_ORYBR